MCETLGLPARSVAFQVLLDPTIAATAGAIVGALPVSGQVLAKEDFAPVVPASVTVTAGALVDVDHALGADEVAGVRKAIIAAAEGQLGAVLR